MNKEKKSLIYMVIAAVLWSTAGVLFKYVTLDPLAIAGTRSGIAGIVLAFYLRKPIKIRRFKAVGAAFYCVSMVLFISANKMTTSANAVLLQYTSPIWVALLSVVVLKEKVTKLDWTIIFIVLAGMVLFFMGDLNAGQMVGNLFAILSGISIASMMIALKFSKQSSPVEIPLLGNFLTFFICLPFIIRADFDMTSVIVLLVLGVFQLGISYILFSEGTRYVSALEASLITLVEPLLNPIWVVLFKNEVPSVFTILGGFIVIAAMVVRTLIKSKKLHMRKGRNASCKQ